MFVCFISYCFNGKAFRIGKNVSFAPGVRLRNYSGPVHTNAFSFENAFFFIRFRLPSTLIRSKTEMHVCLRKRRFSKTLSRVEVFENGGSASLCGRAKTDVFENDYVTGIGMSQLKKQNGCFLIRFRWSCVDGRKCYKNASVDGKLFIRFQETEYGGFRKRITSVCIYLFASSLRIFIDSWQ